ncbi:MAG: phytanoyl-CoA dioxygenase family protein [Pirellulales bacterium]|nr:phytanoyl-CoA dioxygenase family protein [Pirellulales bacterium]
MPVLDLSSTHEQLTDLFRSTPPSSKTLSEDQVDAFHRNGYLKNIPILNNDQVEILRNELDALSAPDHPARELWYEFHSNESSSNGSVLFHALGAWRISPAFHDALWNPRFTIPASQLLGGNVRFWHDQVFCKPPRCGGPVAWHQDYSYWTRTGPMNHLTCWIALDDCDRENGCLHYIRGSHRWSLLPMPEIAGSLDGIRPNLNAEQQQQLDHPEAIEISAGEACFHHPLTLHGSDKNRSDRPRRAMVINVVLDGTKSLSDEPLLKGVDPIPHGEPLGGRFFPQLTAGETSP